MRLSTRISLVAATATAAVLASFAPAHAATPVVVLDSGHVDVIGVAYEDGALNLHVHDEESEAEYTPHQVRIDALPGSQVTVPDDPAYAFLGAPGTTVWVLPEDQDEALLWPGMATEELEPGVFTGDTVQIKVLGKYGPGNVSIFQTDSVGAPIKLVDSSDGLPDSVTLPVATHTHANWAFTAPGDYYLVVVVTAQLAATGKVIVSNPGLYQFRVHA